MMPIIYFTAVAAILFLVLRLTCGTCVMGGPDGAERVRLPIVPLGWALSLFFALTYIVCVVFDLIFPDGNSLNGSLHLVDNDGPVYIRVVVGSDILVG